MLIIRKIILLACLAFIIIPSIIAINPVKNKRCTSFHNRIKNRGCRSCPPRAICEHRKIVGCVENSFDNGNTCEPCPTLATCDGSSRIICDNGMWLIPYQACVSSESYNSNSKL